MHVITNAVSHSFGNRDPLGGFSTIRQVPVIVPERQGARPNFRLPGEDAIGYFAMIFGP